MRMPFGMYKGLHLSEIPDDYLRWMLDNLDVRPPLRRALEAEAADRGGYSSARNHHQPQQCVVISVRAEDIPLVRQIVDGGFRAIARAHHPDTGGSNEGMVRLNDVATSLRQQLMITGAR